MIVEITFNWFSTQVNGEEFSRAIVGKAYGDKTCVRIEERLGETMFYDIFYSDGTIERVFNPNRVVAKPE